MSERLLNKTWFWIATSTLALAWLLPNHYPPWLAFHIEAWCALVLTIVALGVVARSSGAIHLHPIALVVAGVVIVPMLQFADGQITYFGTAWMSILYLAGLALAVQIGAYWQSRSADEPVDFIFAAMSCAAAISTVLQLYQLMRCEFAGMWVMHVTGQTRFFANLAQPNQLGTLQILGALGCGWAYHRKSLPGSATALLGGWILLGVALTGSRTAYINVILMGVLTLFIYWQPQWLKVRWTLGGLAIWCLLCALSVPELESLFDASESTRQLRVAISSSEPRLMIWQMFFAASMGHPWVGWGFGQISTANFSVATQFPAGMGQFNATHNLLLDSIIWAGYPLTLALLGLALWWGRCLFRHRLDAGALYRVGFVVVMITHSMLELPLHYAYFLLPFGIVLGTLDFQTRSSGWGTMRREALLLLLIFALSAVLLTARDYFRIEASSYALRFEDRGIWTSRPFEPPRVLVLDQFSGYFELSKMKPVAGIPDNALQSMRNAVNATPSARTMFNLAANLALNGEPNETRHWLKTLCKVMDPAHCLEARERWIAGGYPQVTGIDWPMQ